MIKIARELKKFSENELKKIIENFDNKKNIQNTLDLIINYIEKQKEDPFKILGT